MNSSCKESITMSVDAINQLTDIVGQLGKDGVFFLINNQIMNRIKRKKRNMIK